MVGLGGGYLAINSLCFGQIASAVLTNGQGEGFINRRHEAEVLQAPANGPLSAGVNCQPLYGGLIHYRYACEGGIFRRRKCRKCIYNNGLSGFIGLRIMHDHAWRVFVRMLVDGRGGQALRLTATS